MKYKQQPHTLLMVRPSSFGFNSRTASSNPFQQIPEQGSTGQPGQSFEEFDRMVDLLQLHEVDVRVFPDTREPVKPDAVFPNNWVSFHEDGTVILYPMMAENRRPERRMDIIEEIKKEFIVKDVVDLSGEENNGKYLEGTGSMVFDHAHRIAYACRSPRTDEALVKRISELLKYEPVIFNSTDDKNVPVYHTNVMMCIGQKFAVVCLDSIKDENDQEVLLEHFAATEKKVIAISFAQMKCFAGNMLEVQTQSNEPVVVLSESALKSLLPGQLNAITRYAEVLPVAVNTIEKWGGGSVRCMLAGIHLPKRNPIKI